MRHALSWIAMGAAVLSCTGSMDLGAGGEPERPVVPPDNWSGTTANLPEVVTGSYELPYDLAARDGQVFWTADHNDGAYPSYLHWAVEGGTRDNNATALTTYERGKTQIRSSVLYDAEAKRPRAVSVDDTSVYWAHDGILYCPLAGCVGEPSVFDTSGNMPTEIAVDTDSIYWTSVENSGVFKCPKSGCHGAPEVIALNQPQPFQIVLDETAVYWIRSSGTGSVYETPVGGESLMRAAKDGTAVSEICDTLYTPIGLAVNATHVYWSQYGDDQVLRCPKTGCVGSPELIATSGQDSGAAAILLDDKWVYWLSGSAGGGSLLKCPLDGCGSTPTVLANRTTEWGGVVQSTRALAQDSDYLYWADAFADFASEYLSAYGAIWRMHK